MPHGPGLNWGMKMEERLVVWTTEEKGYTSLEWYHPHAQVEHDINWDGGP